MQIVIDINEKLAKEIREEDLHIARGIVSNHQAELALAIENSIPLSEYCTYCVFCQESEE